jgi:hypothetical protein
MSTNSKLLYEYNVDLQDERDINNGLKIVKFHIENIKRNTVDSLNYSIFSAIFLCTAVVSLLKFDITVWVFNNVITVPYYFIRKYFGKNKKR